MQLSEFFPAFKRFALYEKNLTKNYIKSIIRVVSLLEREADFLPIKKYNTEIIAHILQSRCERCSWSAKTMKNYRQCLATFFDFLVKKGYYKVNPIDGIAKPRLPKSLPRCLTNLQVQKLKQELNTYPCGTPLEHWRNTAIILTFLYTGIRLSELLKLKRNEVNFEEKSIYIHRGKGAKDRMIPIHPKLVPYLEFYLTKRDQKLPVSGYFFTSFRSGKPLAIKNLYAVFKKLSCQCGFKITPHMLRHTMAKLSLEANLNPFTLKEILGHSNIATTQIYMSVSTESIKRSYNKLDLL